MSEETGTIFNIQKFSVHDGPGIRTTVFMKGCPLRCRWCSNVESMNPGKELGFIRQRCTDCGRCLGVCPEKAVSHSEGGGIAFDRETCTACGACVDVCAPGALTVYGRDVTVDEVFKDISRDSAFYQGSGGGITVSGGEPLRQADFVAALFEKCHEADINTCLDTCGYADTEELKKVLRHADNVLYDIKHTDSDIHKILAGVPNERILENARMVAESGARMLVRIPLVKDANDTPDNIEKTAEFVKSLGGDTAVELLPYHRLGIGKYHTLDRPYPGQDFSTPSSEELESVIRIFQEHGVQCTAGG